MFDMSPVKSKSKNHYLRTDSRESKKLWLLTWPLILVADYLMILILIIEFHDVVDVNAVDDDDDDGC